jgi:putative ABC transport system ATP-binding protein
VRGEGFYHGDKLIGLFLRLNRMRMDRGALIEMTEITKIYKMGSESVEALKSVNLSVGANEFVALMGPSGSGKSTLMNIIGCLDSPTSGVYMLNGVDVSSMEDADLADVRNRRIGFIFQTFNLMPRISALENVALPLVYAGKDKKTRLEMAIQVIESVGLADRMHHRPNELSGGQRQRVAIARALVNNPAIILADEPTGNLDSRTSEEIMNILTDIHRSGNTIILVTHEADIAQYAKRLVKLRDGRIESDQSVF